MATATYPDVEGETREGTEVHIARVVPVEGEITESILRRLRGTVFVSRNEGQEQRVRDLAQELKKSRTIGETQLNYARQICGVSVKDLGREYSEIHNKAYMNGIYYNGTNSQRENLVSKLDKDLDFEERKKQKRIIENKLRNSYDMSTKDVEDLTRLKTQIEEYERNLDVKSISNRREILKEKIEIGERKEKSRYGIFEKIKNFGSRVKEKYFGRKNANSFCLE